MDLFEYVGKRIRELRLNYGEGQGLGQEELAKALDVTPNTISRWETATYRPTLEYLEKLARFFNKPILEFFPNQEDKEDSRITLLMRAAKELDKDDLEELRRYAEFRRARKLIDKKNREHKK